MTSALTEEERAFFRELQARDQRFIVVGLSAAVLQGANLATQDIEIWFESLSSDDIAAAATRAGGFFATRMSPPMLGGQGLDRIDVVTTCQGLGTFDEEISNTVRIDVDGVELSVLRLDRIIASKEAANRPKDRAALEQLRAALAVEQDRRDR